MKSEKGKFITTFQSNLILIIIILKKYVNFILLNIFF